MTGVFSKFKENNSGQVAVTFAIAVLPLIALTSAGIDYLQVTKERAAISNALDAAVLATANNNAIADSEKPAYAETHFLANYGGDIKLKLDPRVETDQVSMSAVGEMPLTFGNVVGIENPTLREISAATIANENTVCLMALNETSAEAILFYGGIEYASPTCAVQANSSHASALTSRSAKPPKAESFCTVGGATGEFEPYVKGECRPITDPYENLALPAIPSDCTVPLSDLIKIKQDAPASGSNSGGRQGTSNGSGGLNTAVQNIGGINGFGQGAGPGFTPPGLFNLLSEQLFDRDLNENIDISQNRSGSHVNISPGVFCGGLTIDGINVDFLPGEYIIKDGPLSFINGAEATANDVTFILAGSGAVLNIQSESSLSLKAPKTGPRKGLAVVAAVDRGAPGNRTIDEQSSLIAEGGSLQVLGTVYLPEQELKILGKNTSISALAPSTSFVADTLQISGGYGAKMTIGVDHEKANMPPILPRAEDGARLVR